MFCAAVETIPIAGQDLNGRCNALEYRKTLYQVFTLWNYKSFVSFRGKNFKKRYKAWVQ